MRITRELRDFAAKQNAPADTFIAANSDEAEAGMQAMSEVFKEKGGKFICRRRSNETRQKRM